jgi:cytochrome oxidase Cu insertion factor (SCO1/SenC/PrrC family)
MPLWIMIFLFALPNVLAIYFYLNRDEINLGETTNYGKLVSPVRQYQDMTFTKLDGSEFKLSSTQGKWVLLSIGSSSCLQNCQENLYKIRQIRKAAPEGYMRVTRVFFLTDQNDIGSFNELLQSYQGMEVVTPPDNLSDKDYQNFLANFSLAGEKVEDGIYIIDPLGNYMMAYPPGADAKGILKDVERLLKISQIG